MGQNSRLSGAMLVLKTIYRTGSLCNVFLRTWGPFGDDDDDDDHDMFLIVSFEYTLFFKICSSRFFVVSFSILFLKKC